MPGNLPVYILKDVTLYVDKESKIGQSEEITLPTIEVAMVEMRNGGMIKPREVSMGYSVLSASFSVSGVDPALYALYGIAPGVAKPIIAYGYLQDEDGTEHSARAEMMCGPKKADAGGWKSGEAAPTETEWTVHSYRLFVDDEVIVEIDDFDAKFGGVSVMPGRIDALRLA